MMNVAVVILNYNSASDCRKCIGFLKKQEGVGVEIIVVDNCSPREGEQDSIRSLCEELHCTFIPATENRGYNAGNNIGLRYAVEKEYKYALIANPDMMFPQTDYLKKMVEAMERDEDIVVCGSDIITVDSIHQNPMKPDSKGWTESFNWLISPFRRKQSDTYDFIDNYTESHYCFKVSGCCLLVKSDFMIGQHFFDENLFLYCEEAVLSKQVLRANKKMYYLADVQAIHHHVKSEKGDPIPRFKAWVRSRLYFEKSYNYEDPINYRMKVLGWKSYLAVFILAKMIKRLFSYETNNLI